ncbi:MAG: helix-turn-helix domain-containing protein [Burkholderiales bacterium]|nr:helix-turn-helix domain-containing protein [Burkholderiales bacterium]
MTNIAAVLKSEISRLARKQSRAELEALKKLVSTQRAEVASLKKRLQELEKTVKTLAKIQSAGAVKPPKATLQADDTQSNLRFSAKGLASNRKRLGLSAAEFALLVGTTQQSIFSWEGGKAVPRAKFLPAIASLRGVGKREVAERLTQLRAKS